MDNYIVINGKKAELTDEQLEKLGIKVEKENPFAKRIDKGLYYYITARGIIESETDVGDCIDGGLYNNANYFNDKDFAQQVALHQLLYRKLLKYAYENDAANCDWHNLEERKYNICFDYNLNCFAILTSNICKEYNVYFSNLEIAKQAITDVVEPFMKEHPEFVW